jgi:hypothetical protein
MTVSKEQIEKLLATNDKAVARALVVLYESQTASEQNSDSTHESNGVGFSHAHSFIGCRMAKFYLARGYLTDKQVAYWRKPTPKGRMKIALYWKQLQKAAETKAQK